MTFTLTHTVFSAPSYKAATVIPKNDQLEEPVGLMLGIIFRAAAKLEADVCIFSICPRQLHCVRELVFLPNNRS